MSKSAPSDGCLQLCCKVENRIFALHIEGFVMNKIGGVTLAVAFIGLLLLSSCGDGVTTPTPTPEPLKTERGPVPDTLPLVTAAPLVQASPIPDLSPATGLPPAAQPASTVQRPPAGATSGAGFRGAPSAPVSLRRTE